MIKTMMTVVAFLFVDAPSAAAPLGRWSDDGVVRFQMKEADNNVFGKNNTRLKNCFGSNKNVPLMIGDADANVNDDGIVVPFVTPTPPKPQFDETVPAFVVGNIKYHIKPVIVPAQQVSILTKLDLDIPTLVTGAVATMMYCVVIAAVVAVIVQLYRDC
ncbi:MAG: hypothetical protein SGARI_005334, partial [Bacillariaceae sp.]